MPKNFSIATKYSVSVNAYFSENIENGLFKCSLFLSPNCSHLILCEIDSSTDDQIIMSTILDTLLTFNSPNQIEIHMEPKFMAFIPINKIRHFFYLKKSIDNDEKFRHIISIYTEVEILSAPFSKSSDNLLPFNICHFFLSFPNEIFCLFYWSLLDTCALHTILKNQSKSEEEKKESLWYNSALLEYKISSNVKSLSSTFKLFHSSVIHPSINITRTMPFKSFVYDVNISSYVYDDYIDFTILLGDIEKFDQLVGDIDGNLVTKHSLRIRSQNCDDIYNSIRHLFNVHFVVDSDITPVYRFIINIAKLFISIKGDTHVSRNVSQEVFEKLSES